MIRLSSACARTAARPVAPSRRPAVAGVLLAVLALGLAVLPAAPAQAITRFNPTPQATWGTNGRVHDVVRIGDRIFVAGSFTHVISPTGQEVRKDHLAAFDVTFATLIESWGPSVNGEVLSLAAAPDGSALYFGGRFTAVDGQPRQRAAAVSPIGGLTPWRADANAAVYGLAVEGSAVFMGGDFRTVNNQPRSFVAAVSTTTGFVWDWRPSPNGRVTDLVVAPDNSKVVLAGKFTTINGQDPGNRFGKIGAVGRLSAAVVPWSDSPYYDVLDLAVGPTAVYAGVAGPKGRASAFDLATGRRIWQKIADGDVQAVDYGDGRVYMGGHFNRWDELGTQTPTSTLVTVDPATGNLDTSFSPRVDQGRTPTLNGLGVWAIYYTSIQLHIGGDFLTVSGQPRQRYTRFSI